MARKRMIDPSFWEDPTIGTLSIPARLLFIGMMSHADDEGRIEVDPRYIRRAVFGFDEDITTGLVACYLTEIRELCRSVQFYEVDGRALACFINWKRYQYIQKPQPSKLPDMPVTEQYDTSNVSVSPNRIEENRIEENGGGTRARDVASSNGRNAAAVLDSSTISALRSYGLTRAQAHTAASKHEFCPEELSKIELWLKQTRADKPVAVLWTYLQDGKLPDDLPKSKPVDTWPKHPDGRVNTEELNRIAKRDPAIMTNRWVYQ